MDEIHIQVAREKGLRVAHAIEVLDADLVESALNDPRGLYDPKSLGEALEIYRDEIGFDAYREALEQAEFTSVLDEWEKKKRAHNTTLVVKRIRHILPKDVVFEDGDILCFIGLMNGQIPSE